jgi:NADPH:quinone reductase-like Zn-dependent oxidoreductase
MPTPGPNEIVVKNAAVAINPLDNHMQDHGVFIPHFPAIFGCDVAGTIYAVGSGVDCFSVGDRVIGYVDPHLFYSSPTSKNRRGNEQVGII